MKETRKIHDKSQNPEAAKNVREHAARLISRWSKLDSEYHKTNGTGLKIHCDELATTIVNEAYKNHSFASAVLELTANGNHLKGLEMSNNRGHTLKKALSRHFPDHDFSKLLRS